MTATDAAQAVQQARPAPDDTDSIKMPRLGITKVVDDENSYIPDMILRIADIKQRVKAVYGWRRGKKYLYIGVSEDVRKRVSTHNIIGRVEKVLENDTIDIWYPKDGEKICDLEESLINRFKPKYNVADVVYGRNVSWKRDTTKKVIICAMCGKEFMQKRYWQRWCSKRCAAGKPNERA